MSQPPLLKFSDLTCDLGKWDGPVQAESGITIAEPSATVWRHVSSRVWTPNPQVTEQGPHSSGPQL